MFGLRAFFIFTFFRTSVLSFEQQFRSSTKPRSYCSRLALLDHGEPISRRSSLWLATLSPFILLGRTSFAESTDDLELDFRVVPESRLPFSQHYVENASRLSRNLKWCATHSDIIADKNLKVEILAFSSLYRRDLYTQYGALPGSTSLLTAYSAAAGHFARYGPGVPMSEKLAGTIIRNVDDAEKALSKTEVTERMSRLLEAADRPK